MHARHPLMLTILPALASGAIFDVGPPGVFYATMLNAASDILDLPPNRPKQEKEMVDYFVRQLRLIFMGARYWRD